MAARRTSKRSRSNPVLVAAMILTVFALFVLVLSWLQLSEKLYLTNASTSSQNEAPTMASTPANVEPSGRVAGTSHTATATPVSDDNAKNMEQGLNNYLITIVAMVALGIGGTVLWSRLQNNS